MQPSERYDLIMKMFDTQETVTVPQIMTRFNVSMETARRDMRAMEDQQMIKRVYGGAIRYNFIGNSHTIYKDRSVSDLSEKEAIGAKCAEYIRDGETLYIGAGTTVLEVVKHLKSKKDLTIVTLSLRAAVELIDTDFNIYLLGGKLLNSEWHVGTDIPDSVLSSFFCSKAIIGSLGITAKHGVTDSPIEYSNTIHKILQRCESVYYVGANSKFGVTHPGVSCAISAIDRIFTGVKYRDTILRDFSMYADKFVFAGDYVTEDEDDE